jgi:hypothetical protein
MLMGALLQAGGEVAVQAQTVSFAEPHNGATTVNKKALSIDQPHTPGGEPQLKPMFLDKKLFMPDKWWKYEEADDDRPPAFSVEQTSSVSLGGRALVDHGAQVQYRVRQFPTPAIAHLVLQHMVDASRRPRNVKRTQTGLRQGDEAVHVTTKLVDDRGKMVEFGQETIARYGKFLVYVTSKSDLRALGLRPKSGERRWMSEPIHERVVAAVFARWTRYRTLLASK